MCLPHAASEGTTSVTEAAHIGAVGHEEPAMSDEDRPNDRRPERGNGVRGTEREKPWRAARETELQR